MNEIIGAIERMRRYKCSECKKEFRLGYGMEFSEYVYKIAVQVKGKGYAHLMQCSYGCWRKASGREEVIKRSRRSGIL